MKHTILIIVFLCIELLFLKAGRLFSQEISYRQFENLKFYSNTNELFNFSSKENYVIILQNSKKCDDCFRDINSFAKFNKDSIQAKLVVVILIDSNTLERKRSFAHIKKLMPDFTTYLFQYSGSSFPTLFDLSKTSFSPELVVIEKEKITHVPYKSLFNFPSSEFTLEVKTLLFQRP
jgi:hypothetical protein